MHVIIRVYRGTIVHALNVYKTLCALFIFLEVFYRHRHRVPETVVIACTVL